MPDLGHKTGNTLLSVVRAAERAAFLEAPARRLSACAEAVFSRPAVAGVLRGRWLGHSLHPLLTDFTEGPWMAASFLDLFGPPGSAPAARRLLALGLAAAVPTYLSGLADLAAIRGEDERRAATVHTATVSVAMMLYAASYAARRRGSRRGATALGVAAGIAAFVDGYVGGHLGHVRRTGAADDAVAASVARRAGALL